MIRVFLVSAWNTSLFSFLKFFRFCGIEGLFVRGQRERVLYFKCPLHCDDVTGIHIHTVYVINDGGCSTLIWLQYNLSLSHTAKSCLSGLFEIAH